MVESKQVWLRAFWGFDPENEGYYGFTHEGDRIAFAKNAKAGDWVLIYGAISHHTADNEKRQALGFLELSEEFCFDVDRMSQQAIDRREKGKFSHRWNFGLRVTRAWRLHNNVHIKHIAVEAYANLHRFERTTRGILLNAKEQERALSYPIYEVNVFGESPIPATAVLDTAQAATIFEPSKGPPPSFGIKTVITEDGENKIYLMKFSGAVEILLGKSHSDYGKKLFKVGRSNDPRRRLSELNSGFPKSSVVSWQLVSTHPYKDGQSAHNSETLLKNVFATKFDSVGGEFFIGSEIDIQSAFVQHCVSASPVIKGAPAKLKKKFA
ncbi:GIY-YIG nuclease family protein [Mesorhizobium sp. LCM 4577]|uniref:GIY-YIG nuclease family protein n=1 Tax=Mesorhizobium sp. LCM 4577 TaxID=1848288 RepID=UPI0008D9E84A|nr:GIY-YIG nuclease family protein [Mesorhizobium sp. LCM 4577]